MSEMDVRFAKLIEESSPAVSKATEEDPFADLAVLVEGMAKGTMEEEKVANHFTVQIARSDAPGTIETEIFVPAGDGPHPGLLWMHGGGYVIQNWAPTAYRRICNAANAIVVAPKYRLAPQHKFPAGPNDCLDTYKWMASNAQKLNIDVNRLFITGESAGGGLTTSLAIRIRDENISPRPAGQIPLFPFISPRAATHSYINMGHGKHFISREACLLFWKMYESKPEDICNPIFTAFATDSYADLPPALVINGCADPLLDDGISYAAQLKEAGVDATCVNYQDMPHCFYQWDKVFPTEAATFYAQMAVFIQTIGKSKL